MESAPSSSVYDTQLRTNGVHRRESAGTGPVVLKGCSSNGTRDGTVEPVSRDQILRRERAQGKMIFPSSAADHEKDWQPYPVDMYVCMYFRSHI